MEKMKIIFGVRGIILLAVFYSLMACFSYAQSANGQSPSDGELSKKIVGCWKYDSVYSRTNTVSSDGKFLIEFSTYDSTDGKKPVPIGPGWFGGSWKVKDGIFIMTVSKTMFPKTTKYGDRPFKIIRVNDRELALRDGPESYPTTNILTRIK